MKLYMSNRGTAGERQRTPGSHVPEGREARILRIAIVDDDQEEILRIREMVFNINGDYRVDQFLDGESLLETVTGGEAYDLLLCDVYMKGENGIAVAKKLKSISPQTPVAFITSSREHAVDAFSVDAVHYLVKPVSQSGIVEVFERLKNKVEPRHTLTIRIDRAVNVLFQDDIIRVESHGHNTEVVCSNQTVYSIRKLFREINELLDDTFIQIKKGVTLNMNYISRMTYKDCTTRDGRTYLLRRDHAKDIRNRYYSFIKNKLDAV